MISLKCKGQTGHGSLFVKDTAIEKVQFLIDKFLKFREREEKRLESSEHLTIGDVTTINITRINGGIQANVIPPEITMLVVARMSINIDQEQFERDITDWCNQAGGNIDVEYKKMPRIEPTDLDDNNIYWKAFKEIFENDL